MTFAFGESVTVHRREVVDQDADGNDVYGDVDTAYPRTSVAPRFSQEFDDGTRDTTLIGYSVSFRPAIDLRSTDEMTVRGDRCRIDGQPLLYHSPFTPSTMTRAILQLVNG